MCKGRDALIRVKGANCANLKNLNCTFPKGCLSVVAGPSGSGKSSLVFDVLLGSAQARFLAQRRLAHTFRGDAIVEGLSFAVGCPRQRVGRSHATLALSAGMYPHLVHLFFGLGERRCLSCGQLLKHSSRGEIIEQLMTEGPGTRISLAAPLGLLTVEEILEKKEAYLQQGLSRLILGGDVLKLTSEYFEEDLRRFYFEEEQVKEECSLLLDSFIVRESTRARLAEGVYLALRETAGRVTVEVHSDAGSRVLEFSESPTCFNCGLKHAPLRRSELLYYRKEGACPECFPQWSGDVLRTFRRKKTEEPHCLSCDGSRLAPVSEKIILAGRSFAEVFKGSVKEAADWLAELEDVIGDQSDKGGAGSQGGRERGNQEESSLYSAHKSLQSLIETLRSFGLGYLNLNRVSSSLSSGEMQRVQMATALKHQMSGVLYVFDEPSSGLHPRDLTAVLKAFERLTEQGASVIVIEHCPFMITAADYILELGPGAGSAGGMIQAAGTLKDILDADTATAKFLKRFEARNSRVGSGRKGKGRDTKTAACLSLRGVECNNLKRIDWSIPLGSLVTVAGVSGSGKSSLLTMTLVPLLQELFRRRRFRKRREAEVLAQYSLNGIEGWEALSYVVDVTEGRRGSGHGSTLASLSKLHQAAAESFSRTMEARIRGFSERCFLARSRLGACEHCHGSGIDKRRERIGGEANRACCSCGGTGFRPEMLRITYQGLNVSEVLSLDVDASLEVFASNQKAVATIKMLQKLGLGYLKLNQASSTLSFGEWQRVRIARELSKRRRFGHGLFVLDEPTSGLHGQEVGSLIKVLREIVSRGDTVIVIEHNTKVLAQSDLICELGPGAGDDGGRIIACCSPQEILNSEQSLLSEVL